MTSYLQLTLADGEERVTREFLALLDQETVEEAVVRWINAHPDMVNRVRNRERTARRLREGIIGTRIARPSSFWKKLAEENGAPYPAPIGSLKARRRAA